MQTCKTIKFCDIMNRITICQHITLTISVTAELIFSAMRRLKSFLHVSTMTQTYFNDKEKAHLHTIPNDFISANERRNFFGPLFYFFVPMSLCLY